MDIERRLPDVIRKRYVRKFALLILVIAVLVGGVGLITQSQVSEEVRNSRQAELQNIANSEAEQLAEWRDSQRDRTALLSENDEFEDVDSQQELQSALDNQAERFHRSLHAIHYVSGVDWQSNASSLAAAEITGSTVEGRIGDSLAVDGMEWRNGFSFADDNAVDESAVYANDGMERIAFGSPVENGDVVMVAVFDATERGQRFRDSIAGGYTQVVDDQGEIQFAATTDETLLQYDGGTDVEEVQQGLADQDGFTERDGDVIAYAPVEGTDWVVVKHAPQSNAYTLTRLVSERLIVLIGITLVGFVALGVVLNRETITTLDDLTADARALANGDIDRDITETSRTDELGRLQGAFQEIQSYLQTVAAQANAIDDQEFDADVLRQDVPGDIGAALDQMRHDLEESITELEQSNQKLEQFAYVASHDLQEPLRMVSSYLDLLQTELGDDLDGETEEYFAFAIDGAERMQAMIDGLLTFSRVQTQADPFESVDPNRILDDTRQDLQLKIENARATVTSGDLPTIEADANQLGQLFQNLIKNAIEHGGENTVVEITARKRADATEFAVADNGPGIPDYRQDDIFDIFDTGGDSDGTGIGLAVCQEIVDRHGGAIWLESEEGEGTTFYFTIPDAPG